MHLHLLDTVGAWIAGTASSEGMQLHRLGMAGAGAPPVFSPSLLDAIALATASTRLTEVDDIHMPSCTTPGAVVLPAALALAAHTGTPEAARRLAAGMRVGYAVMTGLGEALAGRDILHQGVWPTLLLAPVTTAAVVAVMLGLDAARTANALAIALTASNGRPGGSASAGVAAGPGTSARWLLLGMAARAGCVAAFSAAQGFNGDHTLLDGDRLPALHGLAVLPGRIEDVLCDGCAVERTSIKPYCMAKHNMAVIDAFLHLLDQGIANDAISRIRVRLPPAHARMVGHYDIETSRLSRITSCAYNIALAGLNPRHLLDIERQQPLHSAAMACLAQKVEVLADARLQELAPQAFPASVELFIGERMVASRTVVDAWGDPARPFDLAATRVKFMRLAEGALDRGAAETIEALCSRAFDGGAGAQSLWRALNGIFAAQQR
ncbi:MmgE/PrpD family protein [Massilia sp. DWR3-1-1]|uniref:MmgE/PrpD family protein n=1 Tax=Massilia sp. DWR3-1-1 TaxID=2804559 RepID=UPI003CEBEA3A